MKLERFVDPIDISSISRRSLFLKDVLSHISFLINEAERNSVGSQWKIKDIYRKAAVDLLEFEGVAISDKQEIFRRSVNLVE